MRMYWSFRTRSSNVISFVESIFAFGGITLGLGNITTYGLLSVQAGLPLLIGALVCIFFVTRQCGLETPFLDVKILGNKNYAVSVIASMVLYLVMMGSSVMMPLYVQNVMGYLCRGVRSGHIARICRYRYYQPLCRQDLRQDGDQKDFYPGVLQYC